MQGRMDRGQGHVEGRRMGQVRQEAHRGAYGVSIRVQPQATYTHCRTLSRHLYSLPLECRS